MSQGTKVFTGLEGLITVKDLEARRRQAQGERFDDLKGLPGQEKAAATAGLLIGDIIARRLQPDEQRQRAEATQNIIRDAEEKVRNAEPIPGGDPALSDFDQRIAIVSTAIKRLEDQGLTTEANQLKANRIQLNAQRLEKRGALQKLRAGEANIANTEANTARTRQLTAFDELGEPGSIVLRGGTRAQSANILADGSAVTTDDNGDPITVDIGQFTPVGLSGGLNDVAPDRKLIREGLTTLSGINGGLQAVNSIREIAVTDPKSVGFQGSVLSGINQVGAGFRGFFLENGLTASQLEQTEGSFAGIAQEAGIRNQAVISAATNLAFAEAIANGNARPTDNDFRVSLKTVGTDSFDQLVLINSLDNLADRLQDRFEFATADPIFANSSQSQIDIVNRKFVTNANQRRDFSPRASTANTPGLPNGRTQEQQDLLDQILAPPPQGQ